MSTNTGKLYIVATPIGNLGDITFRAIETLRRVDYVVCEDTRVSGKLLNHYQISKKMLAMNDFNEQRKIPDIVADLLLGKNIALLSDAGTPLISDPGYKLVRESIAKGIKVEAIPGASAAICALTVSGLPPDKFLFLGYLPKKEGKRKEILLNTNESISKVKATVIVYESPFRLLKTLEDLKEVFGDIEIVVCRELTKMHEEVKKDEISALIAHYSTISPKGELVVLWQLE